MNFVCFSFLSPPATDAESACTGRLLSSLAGAGHNVTLISLDYAANARHLPEDIAKQLLSDRVKVIRMPLKRFGMFRRSLSKFRYGLFGICAEYITDAIRLVRDELRRTESPILLTRCAWPASNVVGWHCRKYAKLWIPHYSDPYPSYRKMALKDWWRFPFSWFWLWRTVKGSAAVSVTNEHALIYFRKILPPALHQKFFVLYHIGSPRLRSIGYAIPRQSSEQKVAVVAGALFKGRNYEAIKTVAQQVPNVRILEYSGPNLASLCPGINANLLDAPNFVTDAMASADAIIVSDLDSGFGYSPYLASKFAYAAVLHKPLICISEVESEMAMLAWKYPGVHFVDRKNLIALKDVFSALAENRLLSTTEELSSLFSPSSVVATLEARIREVGEC